jgi:hypothetical protein
LCIRIFPALILLLIAVAIINISVYNIVLAFRIQGEGYGNNGARFKSFVACLDGKRYSFDGGSHLKLNASGNKVNNYNSIYGRFIIEYHDSVGNVQHESGLFVDGALSKPSYILKGIEIDNTICHGPSRTIVTLSGLCGNDVAINYASNDKKTLSGSMLPNLIRTDSFSFYGSKVVCTDK